MISTPSTNSFLSSYLPLGMIAALARGVSGDGSQPLDASECGCFLINGSVPTYYANHMFFDFRSLSQYVGVPDIINNDTLASSAPPSSDYFNSTSWTDIWKIQTWDNSYGPGEGLSNGGTVLMVNSASNVYIEENEDDHPASDTYMTLRTKRLSDFQTACEFQTVSEDYRFLSLRMLARTLGSAGAVTGMFTYRGADKLAHVQEADVEILTGGPNDLIQYTNQPSYKEDGGDIPQATRNASMPPGLTWSDWVVHRYDWTPKHSIWYVDGQEVTRIEFQTPRDATEIHVSAWSDGGTWSGNMSLNHEAVQQVQWIEVIYNSTTKDKDKNILGPRGLLGKRHSEGCGVVCSIDEAQEAGTSTMLWNSSSMASRTMMVDVGFGGQFMWMSTLVMVVLAWLCLV